jgi:phosphoribosyl 1,2-cyclic phosphodiesterase/CheY-like chemotaxis protein
LFLDTASEGGFDKMKTLVLIESDALTRALISQCLAGQDWRVLEAEDGQAGVELVLKHRPTAVLCDIRTPKRNGFQVCRLIREQEALKQTHVILMTVSRFANDRDTAFASGADDYLVKPIIPGELLRMVSHCSANGEASVAEPALPRAAVSGPTVMRFWGVRGSIPTPGPETAICGGNTSCVEVRVGDQIIILDAGSGIRRLGQSLMKEVTATGLNVAMLITHTHWDHIQGFPFFVPAYNPKVNIRILGYEGAVHGLRGALFEQMQTAFFPVGLDQIATHLTFEELVDMQFELGAVKVRTIFANHPGICLGYRLSTPSSDIVYMPDHETYERCEVERQKAERETSPDGLAYARIQDEKVVDFLRDADVVIVDSQYDESEYPSRRGWGHSCVGDTVQLALRSGAKRLFLFHHDPDHSDEKIAAMVEQAQGAVVQVGGKLIVTAAREGDEIAL